MTEQDKQALIEYYCQRDCGHTREECCLDNCHEIMLIEEFPITPTDTDTISRQAAIKDAESWVAVDAYEKHLQKNVIEWLKEFPSAEHGTNLAEVGTDLISRQAAIDLLSQYPFENVINCISILEEMPSAQSEIYHCIDCALYNDPQCLMAFENACWAEPYGYCHMFTRKENDEDERPD